MAKLKRAPIKWAPIDQEPDQLIAERMVDALVADGITEYQQVNMIRHVMRSQGMYKGRDEHKQGHPYRADNARLDLFVLLQHPEFDARDLLALFDLALKMVLVPIDSSVFDPLHIERPGTRPCCDMGEVLPDDT